MTRYITPAERVRELVAEHGTWRAAADAVGCSHVSLYLVAKKGKPAGVELARKLGLETVITHRRIGP